MSNTNCVDYEDIKASSEYKSEYIIELQKENQRYKQALEFYADKINYQIFIRNGRSNIEHDQGEIARQALGEGE